MSTTSISAHAAESSRLIPLTTSQDPFDSENRMCALKHFSQARRVGSAFAICKHRLHSSMQRPLHGMISRVCLSHDFQRPVSTYKLLTLSNCSHLLSPPHIADPQYMLTMPYGRFLENGQLLPYHSDTPIGPIRPRAQYTGWTPEQARLADQRRQGRRWRPPPGPRIGREIMPGPHARHPAWGPDEFPNVGRHQNQGANPFRPLERGNFGQAAGPQAGAHDHAHPGHPGHHGHGHGHGHDEQHEDHGDPEQEAGPEDLDGPLDD